MTRNAKNLAIKRRILFTLWLVLSVELVLVGLAHAWLAPEPRSLDKIGLTLE